jgi:16S rRNA (uracil1498-N3)-methyltransferase
VALLSPRFFTPLPLECGVILSLPKETLRHMHVLRLRPGDTLTLFNGEKGEFAATLQTLTQKEAIVSINAYIDREAEARYPITLAQGIAGQGKMEWLIEKTVELGMTEITPLLTTRSVVRLDQERCAKRQTRWSHIVQSASEQCGRNRLARVNTPITLEAWLTDLPAITATTAEKEIPPSKTHLRCPTRLLLSPRADHGLTHLQTYPAPAPGTPFLILIGPEGGLTPSEEDAAIAKGFTALHMGPRILRTETAGIAALASLAMCWPLL